MDTLTMNDRWYLEQMLNAQNVDSAKKHIHVQMTGKFSSGQELKGNGVNPIQGSIDLIGYMAEYSRNLDKLTQKSSSPSFEGAYIMFDHPNDATVHFLQAMHSAVTVDLEMNFVRNDLGNNPEVYGKDTHTKGRVAFVIQCLNSIVGPYTFVKIVPEVINNKVNKVEQSYSYLKGTAGS